MTRKNNKDAKPQPSKTKKAVGQTTADPTEPSRGGKRRQTVTTKSPNLATENQGTVMTKASSPAVAAAPLAAQPEKQATARRNAIHDAEGKVLGKQTAEALEGKQKMDPTHVQVVESPLDLRASPSSQDCATTASTLKCIAPEKIRQDRRSQRPAGLSALPCL